MISSKCRMCGKTESSIGNVYMNRVSIDQDPTFSNKLDNPYHICNKCMDSLLLLSCNDTTDKYYSSMHASIDIVKTIVNRKTNAGRIGYEEVLCIPRVRLEMLGYNKMNNRIVISKIDSMEEINLCNKSCFVDRKLAEENDHLKQIIPYIVIKHNNTYFLTKRLKAQSETRLHDLYSLGIGGHINPIDRQSNNKSMIYNCIRRELLEEMHMPNEAKKNFKCIGYIYDESKPVSSCHFGLIHLLEVNSIDGIFIRETDKMNGSFVDIPDLYDKCSSMEGWSKSIAKHIIGESCGNS